LGGGRTRPADLPLPARVGDAVWTAAGVLLLLLLPLLVATLPAYHMPMLACLPYGICCHQYAYHAVFLLLFLLHLVLTGVRT
jgi:hypothetical protein